MYPTVAKTTPSVAGVAAAGAGAGQIPKVNIDTVPDTQQQQPPPVQNLNRRRSDFSPETVGMSA